MIAFLKQSERNQKEMHELLDHLKQTDQLENVYQALETDDYAGWIAPVIEYAKLNNESALGLISSLITHYCDKSALFK